jgi:hypothetical protein
MDESGVTRGDSRDEKIAKTKSSALPAKRRNDAAFAVSRPFSQSYGC